MKTTKLLTCLLLIAPAAAGPTDEVEAFACGSPAFQDAIEALQPHGGSCDGEDHQHPWTDPQDACGEGGEACEATLLSWEQLLLEAQNVAPIPLPPEEVEEYDPEGVDEQEVPLGTVQAGYDESSGQYCVFYTTPDEPTPFSACAGVPGAVGPLLGDVEEELVKSPPVDPGPTPGVEEGGLGSTPNASTPQVEVSLDIGYKWSQNHLYEYGSVGGPVVGSAAAFTPVDPFDPSEVQWWAGNGNETALSISIQLWVDGEPQPPVDVVVPQVGQSIAAALASG